MTVKRGRWRLGLLMLARDQRLRRLHDLARLRGKSLRLLQLCQGRTRRYRTRRELWTLRAHMRGELRSLLLLLAMMDLGSMLGQLLRWYLLLLLLLLLYLEQTLLMNSLRIRLRLGLDLRRLLLRRLVHKLG